MRKKARFGLFGSLGFRVLLVSFVFVAVPLIIYTTFLYSSEYRQKLKDVFVEMYMVESDQKKAINQMQIYYTSVVDLLQNLFQEIKQSKDPVSKHKLDSILHEFTEQEGISALAYVEVEPDGRIICKNSTSPLYVNLDFSKFLNLSNHIRKGNQVFVGGDPVFKWSMYFINVLTDDEGKPIKAIFAVISLDTLIEHLKDFRNWYNHVNITVMNKDLVALASTYPEYVDKKFVIVGKHEHLEPEDGQVILQKMRTIKTGYKSFFQKKKHFSVMANMPGTSDLIMISTPSGVIINRIIDNIIHLSIFLLFILIVGGVAAYLLTLRMARPMKQLSQVMDEVGEGDLKKQYGEDKFGFEINVLGRRFNTMTKSLISHIEEANRERASKESYEKELQIGHQIQRAILPDEKESFSHIEVAAFYQAAKEVAGDFFDWMALDSRTMINIADGVGKGVSSCLYSFDLRSMLRSFALSELSLKEIITRANKLFCRDTKDSFNFVTAFVTIFNPDTNTLTYSNCGHMPLIVKRKDQTFETFTTAGMALGVDDSVEVEVGEVKLNEGDIGILYTDGVTEAQDAEGNLYGEDRFRNLLQNTSQTSRDGLIKEIMADIQAFTKEAPQYDDITLVVFRIGK